MLNITGEQVIFKNKSNTGYYTTTSNKQEDGTFDKNFITVGFRRGVELDNFTKINIRDGFLTHYSFEDENGETQKRFKIMVMDFDVVETYSNSNQDTENTQSQKEKSANSFTIEDVIKNFSHNNPFQKK